MQSADNDQIAVAVAESTRGIRPHGKPDSRMSQQCIMKALGMFSQNLASEQCNVKGNGDRD